MAMAKTQRGKVTQKNERVCPQCDKIMRMVMLCASGRKGKMVWQCELHGYFSKQLMPIQL
jgi:hypothetical protein